MSTIQNLYQQGQLAEAAYADDFAAHPNDPIAALEAEGMSETQASEFVKHWRVADQIPDTSNNGFSATVFESLDHPGEFSLAIRGSTPDQSGVDFLPAVRCCE